MYPLRVLDTYYSGKQRGDLEITVPLGYPFVKKFNVSYVKMNEIDFERMKRITNEKALIIAKSFGRNESDFVDAKYFNTYIENTVYGPIYNMDECFLATSFPSLKRDQHYDFMRIFDEVDNYTIITLIITILIVALLYNSSSVKQFANTLSITMCNLLKNSFNHPKTWKQKLLLTSFALFITLFHIVFLSFLNTNVIASSHIEPVNTLKDLLRLNISLVYEKTQCLSFIVYSEDKVDRMVKARLTPPTFTYVLTNLLKGNHLIAELNDKAYFNMLFLGKCMFRLWSVVDIKKIHISTSVIISRPTHPFFRKYLPANILKRLNQYVYRSLDTGLTSKILPRRLAQLYGKDADRKVTECYFLKEKISAEFLTLSISYFKTTFIILIVVSIIAVIVFIIELNIERIYAKVSRK